MAIAANKQALLTARTVAASEQKLEQKEVNCAAFCVKCAHSVAFSGGVDSSCWL
jgi:Tfp pilus assembly protein PilE